jgi:hypothetical protein
VRKARITETCPECGTDFIVSPIIEHGRSPYKVCPNGHETTLHKLVKSRKTAPAAQPVAQAKPEKSVLLRAREVSIAGQRNAENMALAAMVGCYETLKRTTPARAHGVIDGVFEKTVQVSRQILGMA